MTWFFKSKIFIATICLVLSVLIAFVLAPNYIKSQNKEVEVIILNKNIEEKTLITEALITTKKVHINDIPPNAIKESSSVIGTYAAVPIFKYDFITAEKLTTKQQADNYLHDLADNTVVISVAISKIEQAVGGKIDAGDVVSLIAYDQRNNELINNSDLHFLQVVDVLNKNGESLTKIKSSALSSVTSALKNADLTPATVVMICTFEQSLKIIELENQGKVYFIFRGRGSVVKSVLERAIK